MVFFAVRLTLRLLRAATEISLFLEAQRLLLRFVRPSSSRHLSRVEDSLLSLPSTPIQRRYISANGHVIHSLVAGAENRPKIVLLHGHSMSAAFYFRNFDHLVAHGYCVYAVDLLGWGRSDRPPFSGLTSEDTINWYLDSFDAWRRAMKLEKFTLLGHSLGAYLAMEYAMRASDVVERLVMIAPAAITRRIPLVRAIYFGLPPQAIVRRGGLLGFMLFMFKYPRSGMYISDRLREYTYHLAAQYPPSGEVAVIPIIRLHGLRKATCTRPLLETLSHVSVPIQLVCGETDSSMPVEDVHELYREMKRNNFNVRLAVVDGADHCPHLELPSDFFRAVADFLDLRKIPSHPGKDVS